jgi:hypothetical protein
MSENQIQVPIIKYPSISITSEKFDTIKKICWLSEFLSNKDALIILSSRKDYKIETSYVYYLDTDTGKSTLLASFPAHKNLDNVILFDDILSPDPSIIAAYNNGIVKIPFRNGAEIVSNSFNLVEIKDFSNATSMDYKGNLVYTRENDNLLYVKNLQANSILDFNNTNQMSNVITYYSKPCYVVDMNLMDNIIAYTSINKNKIDLYAMKNGVSVTRFGAPVIKDVITTNKISDGFGFTGMNISPESKDNKSLNIFMIRRTIDDYNNNDDFYKLDTIPYNLDALGQVPAIDSSTFNADFTLVYTSYDKNHEGSLKLCNQTLKPKVVVSNENIFGPISLHEKRYNTRSAEEILYYTYENNNVKIKVCDGNGKLVKDLTDMILKEDK